MDFTHSYPKEILDKAEVAARVLTREFERRDIDIQFGEGVDLALTYGAAIPKLLNTHEGVSCRMVLPWQFAVYREDKNDFADQEAVVETNLITPFDFWRRVSHLPNAIQLFKKARSHARRNSSSDNADTFFHQVLIAGSAPAVQSSPPFVQQPGGVVQTGGDASSAMIAPEVAEELIAFHELWVRDDERDDYTTIQIAEPDILIAPRHRKKNMFVPDYLPYGLIQPNRMNGYFWGRSEITDLQKLQHLLRDRLEDIKKLMSLQYDRRYAFMGGSGMTDEDYDSMLEAGYFNLESGAKVEDITPDMPKEAFADIHEILKMIDEVSGFQNILSGQGEPGVRAGNHAETLLRTASPRLRDRALMVERQCADLADKAFELMCAKEAKAYWTREGEEFLLAQLPDDRRIMVDSHSSSPIYEDNHQQIAFALAKLQMIGGEDLIDLLPLPRRDLLKEHLRQFQENRAREQQELLQSVPPAERLKAIQGGKKH